MAVLCIVKFPNPLLSRRAQSVGAINGEIKKLMEDMLETMYTAPGVGLAAPQVGVDKRVIVIDVGPEDNRSPVMLADPEIISGDGDIEYEEGCLSLPGFYLEVERKSCVTVKGINQGGHEVVIDAEGLFAIVLQHEIDHLNGVLLVDRVSRLKRDIYRRKIRREEKEKEKEQRGRER